ATPWWIARRTGQAGVEEHRRLDGSPPEILRRRARRLAQRLAVRLSRSHRGGQPRARFLLVSWGDRERRHRITRRGVDSADGVEVASLMRNRPGTERAKQSIGLAKEAVGFGSGGVDAVGVLDSRVLPDPEFLASWDAIILEPQQKDRLLS